MGNYSPRIKMCGFTRSDDISTAIALGVDAIGLVFYPPSKRAVTIKQAAELAACIPPFAHLVGLFVNAPSDDIYAVLKAVPLSLLQFHGDEDASYCESFERPYIKAIRLPVIIESNQHRDQVRQQLANTISAHSRAMGFLLDVDSTVGVGGTGQKFDWGVLPEKLPKPIVLAGGLSCDNVADAIRINRPYAVDVSSGIEASPGIKDAEKMAAFVNQVKSSR
jgi:phosphoribosylanthranilate isomerase